ncbi:putative uncharacterized transposon-derived protein F54H12.3 [Dictyocoela muelleri]|nr:putative uncharacterized transposon-derived protein F54H12.3 [Dictyocoela muelleri]
MIDLIDMRQFKEDNDNFGWILTIIDVFSKFAFAYCLKYKSGNEVKACLEDLFYKMGPPKEIQCDNGKEFKNEMINRMCDQFRIKMIHGRVRYPQSQGQVERFNQTLTRFLEKHIL